MFNNAVLATACEIQTNPPLPNNYDIIHLQYHARRSLEMSTWHSVRIRVDLQSGKKQLLMLSDTPSQQPATGGNRFTPTSNQILLFSPRVPHSPFLPLRYDQYSLSLGNIIRAMIATSNIVIHRVAGSIRTSRI